MDDYRNKARIDNDIVIFMNYDGVETQLGNIKNLNIQNGYLITDSQTFPLDELYACEAAILKKWTELYPNGKQMKLRQMIPQTRRK